MKTILKISTDVYSNASYDYFKEEINYLANELNIFCEVKNNNFLNSIEEEKRYYSDKEDYKNKISVNAKGYCQNEWQEYIIYYNENELNTPQKRTYFSFLIKELEKSFTHFNDYFCELLEETEINGKKFTSDPFDFTSFSIRDIEFPDEEEIKETYNSIYGKNYDEILISVD